MTAHSSRLTLAFMLLATPVTLAGCATDSGKTAPMKLAAPNATEQYSLEAETATKSINLRINPNGLSDNQRLALDQIAQKASWTAGEPVNVEIITGANPGAVAAGQTVGTYLITHDVAGENLSQRSEPAQPADIITVNMVAYQARTYACGQTWENLAATRNNTAYQNFGCAVTSNLAAQIADPRDLKTPRTATSADIGRRAIVFDKYRKGEVTSSMKDDEASGSISKAIN